MLGEQQVQEPTLLAIFLTGIELAIILGICVVAMAGFPTLGYLGWTVTAVTIIWAWLVLNIRRKPSRTSPTGRQRWFRRLLGWARLLFLGVLTCWLGLMVWSNMNMKQAGQAERRNGRTWK